MAPPKYDSPRPAASNARQIARQVLARVLFDAETLDQAESAVVTPSITASDSAFARLLVRASLRGWQRLAAVQAAFLDRPLPRQAAGVEIVLRLGLCQLLLLALPAHAAIGETVALLGDHPRERALKGLVNGLLRAVDRDRAEALRHLRGPGSGLVPKWLLRRWYDAFGKANVAAFLPLLEQPPRLMLSGKPGWQPTFAAEPLAGGSWLLPDDQRDPRGLPGFAEGQFWVQDVAAAAPARALLAALGSMPQTVVDLCAAPGGKTMQLAAAGHRVIALDNAAPRLARLSDNLARTGLTAQVVCADGLAWSPAEPVDAVLLDAPCSATGTVRRHPELPLLRSAEGLAALLPLQRALLERAAGWLRPGGLLLYAVCALEWDEGEGQMATLPSGLRLIEAQRLLPGQLSDAGNDGFYWALLEKTAAP